MSRHPAVLPVRQVVGLQLAVLHARAEHLLLRNPFRVREHHQQRAAIERLVVVIPHARCLRQHEGIRHAVELLRTPEPHRAENIVRPLREYLRADEPAPRGSERSVRDFAAEKPVVIHVVPVGREAQLILQRRGIVDPKLAANPLQQRLPLRGRGLRLAALGRHLPDEGLLLHPVEQSEPFGERHRAQLVKAHVSFLAVRAVAGGAVVDEELLRRRRDAEGALRLRVKSGRSENHGGEANEGGGDALHSLSWRVFMRSVGSFRRGMEPSTQVCREHPAGTAGCERWSERSRDFITSPA